MFSSLKAFLVTIAMISFLTIIGSFLHLQTDVSGSASIYGENMASHQPLLLFDMLSPSQRVQSNINNYNNDIYGIKYASVDWVNSVQPKATENSSKNTVLNKTDLDKTTKLLIRIIAPVQNSTYVSKEITVNGAHLVVVVVVTMITTIM